jgi:hypothetical protein
VVRSVVVKWPVCRSVVVQSVVVKWPVCRSVVVVLVISTSLIMHDTNIKQLYLCSSTDFVSLRALPYFYIASVDSYYLYVSI